MKKFKVKTPSSDHSAISTDGVGPLRLPRIVESSQSRPFHRPLAAEWPSSTRFRRSMQCFRRCRGAAFLPSPEEHEVAACDFTRTEVDDDQPQTAGTREVRALPLTVRSLADTGVKRRATQLAKRPRATATYLPEHPAPFGSIEEVYFGECSRQGTLYPALFSLEPGGTGSGSFEGFFHVREGLLPAEKLRPTSRQSTSRRSPRPRCGEGQDRLRVRGVVRGI